MMYSEYLFKITRNYSLLNMKVIICTVRKKDHPLNAINTILKKHHLNSSNQVKDHFAREGM